MSTPKRRRRRLKIVFYYPIVAAVIVAGVVVFANLFQGGLAPSTPDTQANAVPSPPPIIQEAPTPLPQAATAPPEEPLASSTGRLLPYRADGRWGYKNTSGQVVIQPRFSAALEFDGEAALAAVNTTGEARYGLIDRRGNWILDPVWEDAVQFSEGLAAVKQNGLWGFADATGGYAAEPEYDETGAFHEDRARVRMNDKWGYIDNNGAIVVEAVYDYAADFSEGRAFTIHEGADVERPIIDTGGEQVGRLRTATGTRYCEGLAMVDLNEGKFGYVGLEATLAFNTTFQEARDFSEGLAPVRSDGEWHYINPQGLSAFDERYEDAQVFSEGLAAVKTDGGKYGYIDVQGEIAVEAAYDEAEPFKDGYALVRRGPERGIIDKLGQFKLLYADVE